MKGAAVKVTRVCTKCGQEKPEEAFGWSSRRKNRRRYDCRDCRSNMAMARGYYKKPRPHQTREYLQNRDLLRYFGITLDQYNELLQKQDGCCALCGNPPTTRRLAVDHDHQTGRIRGLLCGWCNRALGLFRDDPALLTKAIGYLEGS